MHKVLRKQRLTRLYTGPRITNDPYLFKGGSVFLTQLPSWSQFNTFIWILTCKKIHPGTIGCWWGKNFSLWSLIEPGKMEGFAGSWEMWASISFCIPQHRMLVKPIGSKFFCAANLALPQPFGFSPWSALTWNSYHIGPALMLFSGLMTATQNFLPPTPFGCLHTLPSSSIDNPSSAVWSQQ